MHEFALEDLVLGSKTRFVLAHSPEFIRHLHELSLGFFQLCVEIPNFFRLVGGCKSFFIGLVSTKCLMTIASEFTLSLKIWRGEVTEFRVSSSLHFGLNICEAPTNGEEQNSDKKVEQEIYR